MDARLLDVIIGVAAFLILIALLALLPIVTVMVVGTAYIGAAYIIAIIIFVVFLSGAGYMVNEKIT